MFIKLVLGSLLRDVLDIDGEGEISEGFSYDYSLRKILLLFLLGLFIVFIVIRYCVIKSECS